MSKGGRKLNTVDFSFESYFPVYTVRAEDCMDDSILYNILSESYSNFMSQSPLANATKRGSAAALEAKHHQQPGW